MKKYKVTLKLASGMLIGSGNDTFELGGVDATTITDSEGKPYIPASSFKGKLRYLALSEIKDAQQFIDTYFGEKTENGKTVNHSMKDRVLFSDLLLVGESKKVFEIKSENTITEKFDKKTKDIKKQANPRTNKRTVSGLEFEGYIYVPNHFNEISTLQNILALLENYYIGGQGSRGYGWVESIMLNDTPLSQKIEEEV